MEELTEEKIIRDKVFKKALEESFIKYDIVCRTLEKRDIEPHYFAFSLLGQRGDKKYSKLVKIKFDIFNQ